MRTKNGRGAVQWEPPAHRPTGASPPERMQEADQPVIAQSSNGSVVADPEPLPADVSPRRLRRGLLRLGGLVAIAVLVVTLGPGLGELRSRFAKAQPVWRILSADS